MVVSALASGAAGSNVGWGGFGNTPDENRHSPLTSINTKNVDQLGRLFTVDFIKIDPGIKKNQQSFPVESDRKLYVTTGDGNVFAINATTGDVLWRWKPTDTAIFKNFGIVANRGVAYCDGHIYVLLLDMTIVELDPSTGRLVRQVPIAAAVPGASSNYGYSETSAPICANHRVIVGAAGSEYGVRGFVMAYHTNLTPAWPNPFWTVPPEGTGWRKLSRIVGGGVVWTPTTVDTKTNTLYFGTGSATPLYYPDLRPGNDPRADSLIAVDLATGKLKWWQQQMASNQWSYDTAQPPLVYDGKVGGKKHRVVSVATMEGLWFAYDAATGKPFYQRVKVIDHTEHPALQPGKPVVVYPSSLGGVNYSPASYDPRLNYIFNGAAETAAVDQQVVLTPEQRRKKLVLGDVFVGLENGDFGTVLKGWHDYGSISAIDVNTGGQVWKDKVPEPERGGIATTDGGVGFSGGGDGVLRAFDLKTGQILWRFQTGFQIAAGVSVYSVAGKEYLAVTVGGTATSSGGGTQASQLQVFGLGGSTVQSPPPRLPASAAVRERVITSAPAPVSSSSSTAPLQLAVASRATSARTMLGVAHLVTGPSLVLKPWDANSSNEEDATGRLLLGRTPVAGARISVDGYVLPAPTRADGAFNYPVDITIVRRHMARVADASRATANGKPLTAAEQQALRAVSTGISVGYALDGLKARVQNDGTVLITGHAADTTGAPPPGVALYTYQLAGIITDAGGKPVHGAIVVTRTQDRNFWTFSSPSDAAGHYSSFFAAGDQTTDDPFPVTVQVGLGDTTYAFPFNVNVNFARTKSAQMNLTLPTSGGTFALPTPTSYRGAIYEGLVVGTSTSAGVVRPVSAHWIDSHGNFSMVLPRSTRGKRVSLWEGDRLAFSAAPAVRGGVIDLRSWPKRLGSQVAVGLGSLSVP
jgi:alcohol dehydrogenase (cytochrome c)